MNFSMSLAVKWSGEIRRTTIGSSRKKDENSNRPGHVAQSQAVHLQSIHLHLDATHLQSGAVHSHARHRRSSIGSNRIDSIESYLTLERWLGAPLGSAKLWRAASSASKFAIFSLQAAGSRSFDHWEPFTAATGSLLLFFSSFYRQTDHRVETFPTEKRKKFFGKKKNLKIFWQNSNQMMRVQSPTIHLVTRL